MTAPRIRRDFVLCLLALAFLLPREVSAQSAELVHISNVNLQNNPDMIVVDVDFGDIRCVLRTAEVDPVGPCGRHKDKGGYKQEKYDGEKLVHSGGPMVRILQADASRRHQGDVLW